MLLQALLDLLSLYTSPGFSLKSGRSGSDFTTLLPSNFELAHPVRWAFGHWNAELNPSRVAVLAPRALSFRAAPIRAAHSRVAVEVGTTGSASSSNFVFLLGAAAGAEREELPWLVLLHVLLQGAVAHGGVADEVDLADLDLRTLVDDEGDVDQLRAARDRFDLVRDSANS